MKSSTIRNMFKPSYILELGMAHESDSALLDKGIDCVRKRFPGMRFRRVGNFVPSFCTNVCVVVPTDQLYSVASAQKCTSTELLASIMRAAQESAFADDFLLKGRCAKLYISESPTKLSSYKLHGGDGRRVAIPAFGRNSRTFCDLGEVYLPEDLASEVYSIDFRIARQPGRGSACTAVNFGGKTIINCSRRSREHKFEQFFVEGLRSAGLDAKVVFEPVVREQVTVAYSAL